MARRVGPRRWPLAVIALLALSFGAFTFLSAYYIDLLWFKEVGFGDVFWTTLWSKIALGVTGGAVFSIVLWGNLLLVRRMAPTYRVLTPDQQVLEPFRRAVAPYLWWLMPLGSAALGVLVGIGASRGWQTFLLWRNSGGLSFHMPDPLFHRDAAFYVFTVPAMRAAQTWLFGALTGIIMLVALAHVFFGGIRPQARSERFSPQVKAHLSVLLGLLVLVKAWGFMLDRYDVLLSARGVVAGASYTDVKAQLPAYTIMTIVAVFCAVLFLVNIRMRGWALPVIGVALLGVTLLLVGGVIPTAVQKFSVEPQELQREAPYIANNIEATRAAFQLDAIDVVQAAPTPDVEAEALARNQTAIENIRLWDPQLLRQDFEQLQRLKPFYEFHDVDVDRYQLGADMRMVMLSPREVSQSGISTGGKTWQNLHLVYTHGYAAAASLVNGATEQGAPPFVLHDVPPTGDPSELADALNGPDGQPRIYYGQLSEVPFVIANSGADELDYLGGSDSTASQVTSHYEGSGGIPVGGFFRKALFAWRFGDLNLLISNLIKPESRILLYRDIEARVPKAAPFLKLDGDPYAAIVGGRVVWIWDAYTATDRVPYSQPVDLDVATQSASETMSGSVNYIRNSVKVVVDAYDGSMKFYIVDHADPIIAAWARIFPDLFTSDSEVSPELQAHFRYPENLLQIQATQYAAYHVTDPSVFYQKQDFWAIPGDPALGYNQRADAASRRNSASDALPTMRPYYVLTRLPQETSEEFALILPFVPQSRQNMVAWMAARSDPAHYGELMSYEFPSGTAVNGPVQVFNNISAFPRVSSEVTLLGNTGSQVRFGNLLVIPIEDGFLYVQPLFVESDQQDSFPELRRVVVAHGGRIGIGATLEEALVDSGLEQPPPGGTPVPPVSGPDLVPGSGSGQVDALLQQALEHFDAADVALKAGDLATYQQEIDAAQALVRRAGQASG